MSGRIATILIAAGIAYRYRWTLAAWLTLLAYGPLWWWQQGRR